MIKVIIVEDEAVAARHLERMLLELPFPIQVVAKIESVKEAIETLLQVEADLIFMDIHLTDGNAFQIFEAIENFIPVIFTTAYDQYTLKAFKQNSIDYLLKPIDKQELEGAIQKYEKIFSTSQSMPTNELQSLMEFFGKNKKYKKRVLVNLGKKMKSIDLKEVAYFFVENKTTYLQAFEGRIYPIDYSLTKLEEQLDPELFYRVNRQFLVANQAIVDIYYLSTIRLKVNLTPPFKENVLVTIDKIGSFKRWLN